ncbi:hypothetical protein ES707_16001 [subsurface metagenome]
MSIGAILLTLITLNRSSISNSKKELAYSLFAYGILVFSLSFLNIYGILVLVFLGIGISTTLFNIVVLSILQSEIPNELRGKIFSLISGITMGLAPLSYSLFGILGDYISNNIIFLICGIVLISGGIYINLIKDKASEKNSENLSTNQVDSENT